MLLNFNKPKGITSQEAVSVVKNFLGFKKAGHAGTLDPIATGVLLISLGESTRFASYFSNFDKEYTATLKLGERTDTFDAHGKIIEKKEKFSVSKEKFREIIKGFEGKQIQQVPPFSAVKKNGMPLYKLARKGLEIERPSKEINIYNIELLEFNPPTVKIKVKCSKGTYIRTLVDDIGKKLDCFAHVVELTRTAVGPFKIKNSFTLEDLKRKKYKLLSPDAGLIGFPKLKLKKDQIKAIRYGSFINLPQNSKLKEETILRLYDGKKFIGLGVVKNKKIKPERLIPAPQTQSH